MSVLKNLSKTENNAKKIGLFRTLCSIFGGLIISYLCMAILILILPMEKNESIIIALILCSVLWASSALWIVLSHTKLIVLLKVLVPTILLIIVLFILSV
jgi:hypothetical protein